MIKFFKRSIVYGWHVNTSGCKIPLKTNDWIGLIFSIDSLNQACTRYICQQSFCIQTLIGQCTPLCAADCKHSTVDNGANQ